MSEEFKIHGAVRYKGRAFLSGQEKELLEAGFNPAEELGRMKEREGRLTARARIRGESGRGRNRGRGRGRAAEAEGSEEAAPEADIPLHEVRVQDLRRRLAKIHDVDEVFQLQSVDDRVTAQPLYAARLEELREREG